MQAMAATAQHRICALAVSSYRLLAQADNRPLGPSVNERFTRFLGLHGAGAECDDTAVPGFISVPPPSARNACGVRDKRPHQFVCTVYGCALSGTLFGIQLVYLSQFRRR